MASGRLTATTPACLRAAIPPGVMHSRWSAEAAPTSAASSAPPQALSWSAWSFGRRPCASPARPRVEEGYQIEAKVAFSEIDPNTITAIIESGFLNLDREILTARMNAAN